MVMKHGNMLPREMIEAPSMEIFKSSLDGTLSNLILLKMLLLIAGRLN